MSYGVRMQNVFHVNYFQVELQVSMFDVVFGKKKLLPKTHNSQQYDLFQKPYCKKHGSLTVIW